MKKHLIIALFALSASLSTPVMAADSKGLYQTLNYISCTQYQDDRRLPLHTGRNAADEIYVSGWLSAYNYMAPNTYDIVVGHDILKVLDWIDVFCHANPAKSVEAGLLEYTSESYPDREQMYVAPAEPIMGSEKPKHSH